MKLIIDIPEEAYKERLNNPVWFDANIDNAIRSGTPLPKGHGRLIDVDALDIDLKNAQVNLGDSLSEAFDDGLIWASEIASMLPTIIEADKGE